MRGLQRQPQRIRIRVWADLAREGKMGRALLISRVPSVVLKMTFERRLHPNMGHVRIDMLEGRFQGAICHG
jgi:hypothetical protein